MNIQSFVIIIIIAIMFVGVIKYLLKNKNQCIGCGNNCGGCTKCIKARSEVK